MQIGHLDTTQYGLDERQGGGTGMRKMVNRPGPIGVMRLAALDRSNARLEHGGG